MVNSAISFFSIIRNAADLVFLIHKTMTQEQIRLFDNFLKEKNKYALYYDTLEKCPIDLAYKNKHSYLARVTSVLVMSFGFFHNRDVNGIKAIDWRILRNEWICYASEHNALGDGFIGIDGKSIVSAINSVFNGKQYTGEVTKSDKLTDKILEESKSIFDKKKISEPALTEEERLREIINLPKMDLPMALYNDEVLRLAIEDEEAKAFNHCDVSIIKKKMIKSCNALIQYINSNSRMTSAKDRLVEMIDLYQEILNFVENKKKERKELFFKQKVEYVNAYNDRQIEIQKAKDRLAEIESEKKPVEEPSKTTNAITPNKSEERVIMFAEQKRKRLSLKENQFSMIYESDGRGVITINSKTSKLITTKSKINGFDLVKRNNDICFRFCNNGSNSYRCSNTTTSLCIENKKMIEFIRSQFNINTRSSIINVSILENTEDKLLFSIDSIDQVEFS